MPTRSFIALAAALAVLAGSMVAATAAPRGKARGKAPEAAAVRTLVDGVASDWDAARGMVSLDAAHVATGPRGLRRLVRRGVTVTLKITPATRVAVVDAGGGRVRVTPRELFDELDMAADEVEVEAGGRLPRAVRAAAGEVVMPASRVVVHLPPAVEDDPGADPGDPGADDGGAGDDLPATDDPGDDPVDPGDA